MNTIQPTNATNANESNITIITPANAHLFRISGWEYELPKKSGAKWNARTGDVDYNIVVKYENVTLATLIHHSAVDIKTNWQNVKRPKINGNSKNELANQRAYEKAVAYFESIKHTTVTIDAASGGEDPLQSALAYLATLPEEQRRAILAANGL